jgi:probable rRNA maturation factor
VSLDLSDVPAELRTAVEKTLFICAVDDGHIGVELVDSERIAELNERHRGGTGPTDVLAFPVDGADPVAGPREIGDVVICPEWCPELVEAAVHGTLHLCGHDHETDDGEMLALQEQVMAALR